MGSESLELVIVLLLGQYESSTKVDFKSEGIGIWFSSLK